MFSVESEAGYEDLRRMARDTVKQSGRAKVSKTKKTLVNRSNSHKEKQKEDYWNADTGQVLWEAYAKC